MALQIQDAGAVAGRLREFFRLTGTVKPELEEFVLPTVLVGDLSNGAKPSTRRHAAVFADRGATVGEVPLFRLEIPGGIIGVVTEWSFTSDTSAQVLRVNAGTTILDADLPTIIDPVFTDERLTLGADAAGQPPAQLPGGVLLSGSRVAQLGTFQKRVTEGPNTFQSTQRPQGWVIGSGTPDRFGFLEFAGEIVNLRTRLQIEWDEYQIV